MKRRHNDLLFAMPLALLLAGAASLAAQQTNPDSAAQTKAVKTVAAIRAALNKNVTVDYASHSWQQLLNHLRQKTGIRFIFDRQAVAFVMAVQNIGPGHRTYQLQIKNAPLGAGLQRFLDRHNLVHVVFEDQVLVTTPQLATARQMRQRIDVNVKNAPLQQVLAKIARDKSVQIVVDPKLGKKAEELVSLNVKNVSVETGVRLVAFTGGLVSVRVDGVLVVTTADGAKLLPKETPLPQFWPGQSDEGVAVGPDGVVVPQPIPGGGPRALPGGAGQSVPGFAPPGVPQTAPAQAVPNAQPDVPVQRPRPLRPNVAPSAPATDPAVPQRRR